MGKSHLTEEENTVEGKLCSWEDYVTHTNILQDMNRLSNIFRLIFYAARVQSLR